MKENNSQELMNKQLYLGYVQQVLNKKQHDLIQLQQFLNLRQSQLGSLQYQKNIQSSLNCLQLLRKNQKLISSITIKYGVKLKQLQQLKMNIQKECQQEKLQIQNSLKQQFDGLIQERKILRKKISQYAQLGSYEKYLNQLHDALQEKQLQITQKQRSFRLNSDNSFKPQTQQSSKKKHQSSQSQKRRTKIFTTKTLSTPSKLFYNNNEDNHIKNEKFGDSYESIGQKNHTFGQNYQPIPQINQSSEIMKQEQRNEEIENVLIKKKTQSIYVQAKIQSYDQASKRLRQQKLRLKFIKKWFGKKLQQKHITNKKIKILTLYQWKLNACFDQNINENLQKNMKVYDKNWLKRTQCLRQQQLFPYNKLSINRKNYLEWTFDHMRKVQHRKTIQNSLKSIVRNKIRRQRLVFYYYFFRFFKNTITKVPNSYNNNNNKGIYRNNNQSQYLVSSSSQVLSEDRIVTPHQKSEQRNTYKKLNKSTPNRSQVVKIKAKENKQNKEASEINKIKKESQFNEQRLKQYIYEKEKTQKILATQCVKLQGLIKMIQLINPAIFRVRNSVFSSVKDNDTSQRMQKLNTLVSTMDFKMDLFITKCRLGIANNSNKISTIQNLLGSINILK